jgi:Lrp/AsnC family transcriptional regulator, leucine-responsive regulatory protein
MVKPNRQSAKSRTNGPETLDVMDRKILSALRADGRLTMSELAEKVGLSQSPCWTRVKRLEHR